MKFNQFPCFFNLIIRNVSYIINTRAILSGVHYEDGVEIRKCAIINGVTMFTSLDTVSILLDVLEDISPRISVI